MILSHGLFFSREQETVVACSWEDGPRGGRVDDLGMFKCALSVCSVGSVIRTVGALIFFSPAGKVACASFNFLFLFFPGGLFEICRMFLLQRGHCAATAHRRLMDDDHRGRGGRREA